MENSSQENRQAFEIFQKNFATAGITPGLAKQSWPLNGTILFAFVVLCSSNYCGLVFIADDAETFTEYIQSIYSMSYVISLIFALVILILKAGIIFEFINAGNDLINTSMNSITFSPSFSKCIVQHF